MNTRNLLLTGMLIVALALGAGLIMAQDDGGVGDEDKGAKQHYDYGRRGGFHSGRGYHGFGGRGMVMPGGAALMDLAMESTGLGLAALHEALRDGDSLAGLIEANGGDVEAFIAEATAVATENASARIAERIEAMVHGEHPAGMRDFDAGGKFGRRGFGGRGGFGMHGLFTSGAMGDAAGMLLEATGLEMRELHGALRDGNSLAGLIEANGGDVEAFIAGMSESFGAHVDAVVADGKLGEERAALMKEAMAERLEAMVHGEFPARGVGFAWRGRSHGDGDGDGHLDDDDATETSNA